MRAVSELAAQLILDKLVLLLVQQLLLRLLLIPMPGLDHKVFKASKASSEVKAYKELKESKDKLVIKVHKV